MVETSYIELCFVLPVFLQNLHNCFFLSMLLIPYYTTVFRGQSQNRWYKTAMLLNSILNLLASGIPFSTSRMRYSFVTLKARAFFFGLEMSKQLTLFGTSANDNKRAGNLIYKDPKKVYRTFCKEKQRSSLEGKCCSISTRKMERAI